MLGEVPPPATSSSAPRRCTAPPRELIEPLLVADVLADDDLRVAQAERHSRALRDRSSTAASCRGRRRRRSSRSCASVLGDDIDYDLEFLKAEGGTRSALDTPLWSAVESFVVAARARRRAGAGDLRRLHRQPLAARGVRRRRLRLLPVSHDGAGARGDADPLGGRAGARRPTSSSGSTGCGTSRAPSADDGRARLARRARACARGGRLLRSRRRASRASTSATAPPTRCAGRAPRRRPSRAACPPSRTRSSRRAARRRQLRDRRVARDVERARLRGRGRRRARGDRRGRRLPGEPRAASERRVRRRSRRACGALAPLRPLEPAPLAGDGWAIVSASPELLLSRRGSRIRTSPIKGTRPAGVPVESAKDAAEHVMIVDLERNDLARVARAGQRSLARAARRARARRRHASRRDGRGGAAGGRRR